MPFTLGVVNKNQEGMETLEGQRTPLLNCRCLKIIANHSNISFKIQMSSD